MESGAALDVSTVAVFGSPTSAEEASRRIQACLEVIISTTSYAFTNPKDRRAFEAHEAAPEHFRRRPVFLIDEEQDFTIVLKNHWEEGESFHYVSVDAAENVPQADLGSAWQRLTALMEGLLPILKPTVAVGFAQEPDAAKDPLSYRDMCTDAL